MVVRSSSEHETEREAGLADALTVDLYARDKALAIFSFEEEAQMFAGALEESDEWRVSEIENEALLRLLYRSRPFTDFIALDPLPERLAPEAANLVSVSRMCFLKHLLKQVQNTLPEDFILGDSNSSATISMRGDTHYAQE